MKSAGALPYVLVNMAMTADGKIAPVSRHFEPFGGPRDTENLLALRATADAVMSGARTLDSDPVTLAPGGAKYRRQRIKKGLAEYNLRVVVSGGGTINPEAEIFKHRFSQIIVLTTGRATKSKLAALRALADEVKICGARELDFAEALQWLRKKWKVKRLLCEGGGEVDAALFAADLVDEIHITLCPIILGGRSAPTQADGEGVAKLADAAKFRLMSKKPRGSELFLIYGRNRSRRKIP